MNTILASVSRLRRFNLRDILYKAKCLDEVYVSRHFSERCVERNVEAVDVMWALLPMLDVLRTTTYTNRKMLSCHRGLKVVGVLYFDSKIERRRICLKTVIDSVGNNDYFDDIFTK